ncbi:MAG: arginine repressor [Clostridia bacterium]|nr:arginine repressor [Clostridia bacterium]
MQKNKRLDLILKIISENEIDTQEELTAVLIDKGYNVSQATISRDVKDLGLIKIEGIKKKFKYAKIEQSNEIPENIINLLKSFTVSIQSANNLVVLKTMVGNAGSACIAIDKMNLPQIIGTIAGDDTVLIISKNNASADALVKFLKSL